MAAIFGKTEIRVADMQIQIFYILFIYRYTYNAITQNTAKVIW